jgi:hypothetical protein
LNWRSEAGCAGVCLLFLGAFLLTHSVVALVVAGFLVWGLSLGVRKGLAERDLLRRVNEEWAQQGKRCLVVYSASELWRSRVESWLAALGADAVVLNRSDQAASSNLAIKAHRAFCGYSNHSPAIVVFRQARRPLVFRFYNAFLEAKWGRPEFVDEQERAAFSAMGREAPCALTMK